MRRIKRLATESPSAFGLAVTACFIVLMVILAGLANRWPAESRGWYLGATIGRVISIAALLTVLARFGWLRLVDIRRPGAWPAWLIVLALLAYAIAASTYALTGRLAVSFPSPLPVHVVLFLMAQAFLEEIVFRGLVLMSLVHRWGSTPRGFARSVLVSALLFAGVHFANVLGGNPLPVVLLQCAGAFFLGILLGALVLASNTLYPATLLHGGANVASYLSLMAYPVAATAPSAWLLQSLLMAPLAVFGIVILLGLPQPTITRWRLQNER